MFQGNNGRVCSHSFIVNFLFNLNYTTPFSPFHTTLVLADYMATKIETAFPSLSYSDMYTCNKIMANGM